MTWFSSTHTSTHTSFTQKQRYQDLNFAIKHLPIGDSFLWTWKCFFWMIPEWYRTVPTMHQTLSTSIHQTAPTERYPSNCTHQTLSIEWYPANAIHQKLPTERYPPNVAHQMIPNVTQRNSSGCYRASGITRLAFQASLSWRHVRSTGR